MVNDYFKGAETNVVAADKFTALNITPEMIQEDLTLMDQKYWDYKMWHPMVATMYFVHRYHVLAGKMIEREQGEKQAKGYAAMASRYDLRTKSLSTIRAFWKARQHADAIGCSYDVYIRAAIRHFRANHKMYATVKKTGGKQVMPYPNQIVNEWVDNRAFEDWATEKKARFPIPKHEELLNNPDLWFRPEMEQWLVEEAKRTLYPADYIREAIKTGAIIGEVPAI